MYFIMSFSSSIILLPRHLKFRKNLFHGNAWDVIMWNLPWWSRKHSFLIALKTSTWWMLQALVWWLCLSLISVLCKSHNYLCSCACGFISWVWRFKNYNRCSELMPVTWLKLLIISLMSHKTGTLSPHCVSSSPWTFLSVVQNVPFRWQRVFCWQSLT